MTSMKQMPEELRNHILKAGSLDKDGKEGSDGSEGSEGGEGGGGSANNPLNASPIGETLSV